MKAIQHIRIAKVIANKLDTKLKDGFGVNRLAFYIGSVAPDLNCIYPAHRLTDTNKRFQKRIKLVDGLNDGVIKSFTLGIITHYVCDYFCYAHNNKSLGVKHKAYETGLNNYFELHKRLFFNEEILVEWKDAKEIIYNKFMSDTDTMDVDKHADMVLEQIKILNSNYCEKSNFADKIEWTKNMEQWQIDLDYAMMVCENILSIIIEPIRCVATAYN